MNYILFFGGRIKRKLKIRTRAMYLYEILREYVSLSKFLKKTNGNYRVFYLGRTENNNLGDNGQLYCIQDWIKNNYPNRSLHISPSSPITFPLHFWLKKFEANFNYEKDIIVFQSGYSTQDLGGDHPKMHELICEHLKNARILMMPQTIYFLHQENKLRTARNHDGAKNMLFLARDRVSYEMAMEMFPHIRVMLFPDIVTTLIGKWQFQYKREKIFLCCRDDEERFYSAEEIQELRERLSTLVPVDFGDTQSKMKGNQLRKVLGQTIKSEIQRLSHYKVVITDRYHGTIYALCANTPVIIIKTKDHKVTTGAEWFKGVYDKHVSVATDLNDAYNIAKDICHGFEYIHLSPYFNENYYSKLKNIFENKT